MTLLNTIDLPSQPEASADVLRVHKEATPTEFDALIRRIKHVLTLRGVLKVEISPGQLMVERMTSPLGEVVPEDPDRDVMARGASYILAGGAVELDSITEPALPFMSFQAAAEAIVARGLVVVGVLAPSPELLAAFMGLDEAPVSCFGYRVTYFNDGETDRIVVLGSPTQYLDDTTYGILIDPFLEEGL